MNITNLKGYAISTLITFSSTFLFVICTAMSVSSFTFSKDTILALGASALVSAIRAVAKLIVEYLVGITTSPVPHTDLTTTQ